MRERASSGIIKSRLWSLVMERNNQEQRVLEVLTMTPFFFVFFKWKEFTISPKHYKTVRIE